MLLHCRALETIAPHDTLSSLEKLAPHEKLALHLLPKFQLQKCNFHNQPPRLSQSTKQYLLQLLN
jgi:hypothetical protein